MSSCVANRWKKGKIRSTRESNDRDGDNFLKAKWKTVHASRTYCKHNRLTLVLLKSNNARHPGTYCFRQIANTHAYTCIGVSISCTFSMNRQWQIREIFPFKYCSQTIILNKELPLRGLKIPLVLSTIYFFFFFFFFFFQQISNFVRHLYLP